MCSVLYLSQTRMSGHINMRSQSTNFNIARKTPVRPKSNREGTPSLYNGKGVTFVGHARTACSSETK